MISTSDQARLRTWVWAASSALPAGGNMSRRYMPTRRPPVSSGSAHLHCAPGALQRSGCCAEVMW